MDEVAFKTLKKLLENRKIEQMGQDVLASDEMLKKLNVDSKQIAVEVKSPTVLIIPKTRFLS